MAADDGTLDRCCAWFCRHRDGLGRNGVQRGYGRPHLSLWTSGVGLVDEKATAESRLKFREIREGEYWPPVLPDGKFFGVPIGHDQVMEILTVTEDGLRCGGVSYDWTDLNGISIDGEQACLVSDKYISGGVRFYIATCHFEDEHKEQHEYINGYPVEYCLMNRITFELQRRSTDSVSRSEDH